MRVGYRRVSSIDQNFDRQELGEIDKLYEAKLHYVIPKEELEAVKKNCFSNDSYEDIIEFIGSCYPWHSSWMAHSIGGEPNY